MTENGIGSELVPKLRWPGVLWPDLEGYESWILDWALHWSSSDFWSSTLRSNNIKTYRERTEEGRWIQSREGETQKGLRSSVFPIPFRLASEYLIYLFMAFEKAMAC